MYASLLNARSVSGSTGVLGAISPVHPTTAVATLVPVHTSQCTPFLRSSQRSPGFVSSMSFSDSQAQPGYYTTAPGAETSYFSSYMSIASPVHPQSLSGLSSGTHLAQNTQQATPAAIPNSNIHADVNITIYDNSGSPGACGSDLYDKDVFVALAKPAWGKSTFEISTGAATNPWCGQNITIEYHGREINATILDMCPGCSGYNIDLSLAAWKELTKLDEKTILKASWWKFT
jgi:hypothetical protein